jgi:hypothetical protein
MSKRISTEARLLEWIDSADLAVVTSIMSIATQRVKTRVKATMPVLTPTPLIRKPRRKKTNAVASSASATSFPAGEVLHPGAVS